MKRVEDELDDEMHRLAYDFGMPVEHIRIIWDKHFRFIRMRLLKHDVKLIREAKKKHDLRGVKNYYIPLFGVVMPDYNIIEESARQNWVSPRLFYNGNNSKRKKKELERINNEFLIRERENAEY